MFRVIKDVLLVILLLFFSIKCYVDYKYNSYGNLMNKATSVMGDQIKRYFKEKETLPKKNDDLIRFLEEEIESSHQTLEDYRLDALLKILNKEVHDVNLIVDTLINSILLVDNRTTNNFFPSSYISKWDFITHKKDISVYSGSLEELLKIDISGLSYIYLGYISGRCERIDSLRKLEMERFESGESDYITIHEY